MGDLKIRSLYFVIFYIDCDGFGEKWGFKVNFSKATVKV